MVVRGKTQEAPPLLDMGAIEDAAHRAAQRAPAAQSSIVLEALR